MISVWRVGAKLPTAKNIALGGGKDGQAADVLRAERTKLRSARDWAQVARAAAEKSKQQTAEFLMEMVSVIGIYQPTFGWVTSTTAVLRVPCMSNALGVSRYRENKAVKMKVIGLFPGRQVGAHTIP